MKHSSHITIRVARPLDCANAAADRVAEDFLATHAIRSWTYDVADEWISVSERRPTKGDADAHRNVQAWNAEGYGAIVGFDYVSPSFSEYTHWKAMPAGPAVHDATDH
ncbi:DUF551 domain-containing protein [Burkholderia cepacia]|uniref:DUF551 domain-containing protein n=1 Tax=Burkholderia cepacia TaxID=292 RepID=UPI002AB76526|nr:DUF551 domain-containing protein [Burkholderia cepacia]